jgi:hypothetical protein
MLGMKVLFALAYFKQISNPYTKIPPGKVLIDAQQNDDLII